MSTAMRLATAPYSLGPRARAAMIWKPYVPTFMMPMATATKAPDRHNVVDRPFVTAQSLRDRPTPRAPGRRLPRAPPRYIEPVSRPQLVLVRLWPWLLA